MISENMRERTILHSDLNNFYASVECMRNPSLKNKPVAVAGDPEQRHGIVLAKNYIAKSYGVATGDALWQARNKCRDIVFIHPNFDLYVEYSKKVRSIYADYTDMVEPYGLDECWLDVTRSAYMFGDGKTIADSIRSRVKNELGLTVSVGVSFNKVFAKLGSDMKKPDATTVITSDKFKETIWNLPVNELLYVGRATHAKLQRYGINTIGQLAQADLIFLKHVFGKNGEMLWSFANGLDTSPVSNIGAKSLIKSISNGTTTRRDLVTDEDVKITLYALCESVSTRMREYGFVCRTVQLSVRDSNLNWFERQIKLDYPNRTVKGLFDAAYSLYQSKKESDMKIRSLSVRAANLIVSEFEQLSFFDDIALIQKHEIIDSAVDEVRNKFGKNSLIRCRTLKDTSIAEYTPSAVTFGYFFK